MNPAISYPLSEHALTAWLRAAVWDNPSQATSPPQSTDTTLAQLFSDHHTLLARHQCEHLLAVWAVERHLLKPDSHIRKNIFITTQRQVRQNFLLSEVLALFEEHRLPAILLKGYGLTALYPIPAMRNYGDIDIYIGETHYDEAVRILQNRYPDAYWCSPLHVGHHFIMVLDPQRDLVIELHNHFCSLDIPRAAAAFNDFTQHTLYPLLNTYLNGIDVPAPNIRFNALYLFLHAWQHFTTTGVGFRPLLDWMLTLHQLATTLTLSEWQEYTLCLEHTLRRMHLLRPWQTFGAVLVMYFGLPQAEFPLYRPACTASAPRLYRQILHDGQGARPLNHTHGEMHTFPRQRPATNRLKQRIYTAARIIYDTWQLAKFFPNYAIRSRIAQLQKAMSGTKNV